jgi:WD40 repeat protein
MHTGPLRALVMDNKGEHIYTGGYDKKLFKWNFQTGEFKRLTKHNHLITSLAISGDSKYLISGSADYSIRLFDLETDELVQTYLGHTDDVEFVTFTSDDKYIISTSNQHDGRVLVWDVITGKIMVEFTEHKSSVKSVWTFGDKVFSSDNEGNVYVWNIKTGMVMDNLGPYKYDIDIINGRVEEQTIYLGLDNGNVEIYDVNSHEFIKTIHAHDIGIKCIQFSPSGQLILTAAYDHKVKIWNKDFELITTLPAYMYQWEVGFAFTPDEKYIVGCTFGNKYCIWNLEKNELIEEGIKNCTPSINDIAVSEQGDIATASDDGIFRMNGEGIGAINRVLNNAVGISQDGNLVVWGDHQGEIHVIEQATKELIKTIPLDSGPINSIVFDHYTDSFYVGTYGGMIYKVNITMLEVEKKFKANDGAIKGMVIEEERIVSGSSGGQVHVFDKHNVNNPPVSLIGSSFIINDVAFSKKLNLIATVSRDKVVRIYNADTCTLEGIHNLHNYSIKTVCFDSEGILYAGDYWGYVSIWDIQNGTKDLIKVATNGISFMDSYKNQVIAGSYDGGVYAICSTKEVTEKFRLFDQEKELQTT